ncbi:hypothetical protein ACLB2K_046965 [Fragaria x ananassa]
MDSNTHLNLEHQPHQPNSGLLQFRSAPSSLFVENNAADLGVNKGASIKGSDYDRLFSRFVGYSHTNDSESWSSSFQEFEDKSMVTEAAVTASCLSSQQQGCRVRILAPKGRDLSDRRGKTTGRRGREMVAVNASRDTGRVIAWTRNVNCACLTSNQVKEGSNATSQTRDYE